MAPADQQRKLVTVLFADVSGFTAMSETMDAEDVSRVMNALWQRLDGTITAYGGHIDKHIGDAVMALWGVETAREDDPERAIRAALAMQAELQAFSQAQPIDEILRMRIGINSGPVLLGEVGTTGEFTAMGDTVNTASRLEHAAPVGGILISYSTYQHVRNLFHVVEERPLSVKGKSKPLRVYRIERAKPRAFQLNTRGIEGVATQMVGRDRELEHLQDTFYHVAQNNECQIVTIIGEAGIGKTRLLNEFDRWLQALPKAIVYFRGRAGLEMQTRPNSLLKDIFSFHFAIQESDTREEARQKLESGMLAALGTEADGRLQAHVVGQMLGFDLGESPYLVDVAAGTRLRDLGLTYATEYFRAEVSDRVGVILLEDLQWADSSSLDALERLVEALNDAPILTICLARPELLAHRPSWAKSEGFRSLLRLQPLTDEEARQLVSQILQRVDAVPTVLQELIVKNSQGNPFYAEELIRMLIEDGVIITSRFHWLVNPARLNQVRIPPTLTGLLQARLDKLNQAERTLVQRAAVVGRAFWDQLLVYLSQAEEEELAPEHGEELDAVLGTLEARGVIQPQENSVFAGVREYAFSNVVLREVAYESVLKRDRRAYHARVAKWLLERGGERAQEYAGLIAEHLERAQQTAEAVVYLRAAGEQAQQVSAFREALDFFRRALGLLAASDREERLVLTRQIGRALYELGQWQAAREQLEESLSLARRMANPREIANNLRSLGFVAESEGKYEEAKERLQESLLTARQMADAQQMVAALHALGSLAERQGKYVEARQRLEEGLDLARQYGDQVGAAQIEYVQGALDQVSSAYAEAKTRVTEKLDQLKIGQKRKRLGRSLRGLGRFARRRNDDEEE